MPKPVVSLLAATSLALAAARGTAVAQPPASRPSPAVDSLPASGARDPA